MAVIVVRLRERETRMTSNDRGSQTGKYKSKRGKPQTRDNGLGQTTLPPILDRYAGPGLASSRQPVLVLTSDKTTPPRQE